jgi:hypothetical protein
LSASATCVTSAPRREHRGFRVRDPSARARRRSRSVPWNCGPDAESRRDAHQSACPPRTWRPWRTLIQLAHAPSAAGKWRWPVRPGIRRRAAIGGRRMQIRQRRISASAPRTVSRTRLGSARVPPRAPSRRGGLARNPRDAVRIDRALRRSCGAVRVSCVKAHADARVTSERKTHNREASG